MVIFSKVKLGVSPDINALASLIICLVGACVLLAGYLMRRTERQRWAADPHQAMGPVGRGAQAPSNLRR
jgi:putrescine transport system permease protein